MNEKIQPHISELADKSMIKIVFAVFLIAISYSLKAAKTITSGDISTYTNYASSALAVIAIFLIFSILWLKLRKFNQAQRKIFYNSIEHGFYEKVLNNSIKASFLFSFIFIQLLKVVSKKILPDAPVEFYFYVIMAFMLLTACIVFIIKARSENLVID